MQGQQQHRSMLTAIVPFALRACQIGGRRSGGSRRLKTQDSRRLRAFKTIQALSRHEPEVMSPEPISTG